MSFDDTNEIKELKSIEVLPYEEIEALENEFFRENPQYESIRRESEKKAELLKLSLITKLFFVITIISVIGMIVGLVLGLKENTFFGIFCIFAIICVLIFFISVKIDSKKMNKKIEKLNQYMDTPEYREYSEALDRFYASKGYYFPEEPTEQD